jgi:hypothetical protein
VIFFARGLPTTSSAAQFRDYISFVLPDGEQTIAVTATDPPRSARWIRALASRAGRSRGRRRDRAPCSAPGPSSCRCRTASKRRRRWSAFSARRVVGGLCGHDLVRRSARADRSVGRQFRSHPARLDRRAGADLRSAASACAPPRALWRSAEIPPISSRPVGEVSLRRAGGRVGAATPRRSASCAAGTRGRSRPYANRAVGQARAVAPGTWRESLSCRRLAEGTSRQRDLWPAGRRSSKVDGAWSGSGASGRATPVHDLLYVACCRSTARRGASVPGDAGSTAAGSERQEGPPARAGTRWRLGQQELEPACAARDDSRVSPSATGGRLGDFSTRCRTVP